MTQKPINKTKLQKNNKIYYFEKDNNQLFLWPAKNIKNKL